MSLLFATHVFYMLKVVSEINNFFFPNEDYFSDIRTDREERGLVSPSSTKQTLITRVKLVLFHPPVSGE